MDRVRDLGTLADAGLDLFNVNNKLARVRIIRTEDLDEFTGLCGVFVVSQNDAEVRLVLAAYSLQSDL